MLHLFSQLAAKIYGNSELEDGVDRAWLRREIRCYFEKQYENRAKAHSASKALVEFITGRAWVMSEVGQDVFRFTHRTFLEYFFARHLDELHDSVNELLRTLRGRLFKGEWDVVCHLSLQLKTYRHPRRVAEAIAELHDVLRQSLRRSTRQQASAMRFTASALEYLAGSENEVRSLVTDVYAVAAKLGVSASKEALAAVGAACYCSKERRDLAQTLISSLLADSMRRGALEEVSFACTALSKFDSRERSIPEGVQAEARSSIKDEMLIKALEDPFLAGMYWEWYGEYFEQLFRAHGFKIFLSERRLAVGYFGHPFLYQASLPSLVFQNYPGVGVEEEAKQQLRIIGMYFLDAPRVEDVPKISGMDGGVINPPREAWAKIFNKFRKLDGGSDEVWGLIFSSITVFELFAVKSRSHRTERRMIDLQELSSFRKLAGDAIRQDGDHSRRSLFLRSWFDRSGHPMEAGS